MTTPPSKLIERLLSGKPTPLEREAAEALAQAQKECAELSDRKAVLIGTLERARSHIENRGAFRSHTLMLEIIDSALKEPR